MPSVAVRQVVMAEGSVGLTTVTWPLGAPIAGSVLVMGLCEREGQGGTRTPSGAPWTRQLLVPTSTLPDNWPTEWWDRRAVPADGASFTVAGGVTLIRIWAWELTNAGYPADVITSVSAAAGETTLPITPTAGKSVVILAIGAVRTDGAPAPPGWFTPAAAFSDDGQLTGAFGPQMFGGRRVVASAAGPYTVGETYGGGSTRAAIAAAYATGGGVPAFPDGLGGGW